MSTSESSTVGCIVRSLFALVLAVLSIASCGGTESADDELVVSTCDSAEGTWTYLADEPASIRELPDLISWTDEAGCLINANFLFHRVGDEHCGIEQLEFISIGLPVGTPYTGPSSLPPGQDWEPEFVFNAKRCLGV
jgi:hypothetical protein